MSMPLYPHNTDSVSTVFTFGVVEHGDNETKTQQTKALGGVTVRALGHREVMAFSDTSILAVASNPLSKPFARAFEVDGHEVVFWLTPDTTTTPGTTSTTAELKCLAPGLHGPGMPSREVIV